MTSTALGSWGSRRPNPEEQLTTADGFRVTRGITCTSKFGYFMMKEAVIIAELQQFFKLTLCLQQRTSSCLDHRLDHRLDQQATESRTTECIMASPTFSNYHLPFHCLQIFRRAAQSTMNLHTYTYTEPPLLFTAHHPNMRPSCLWPMDTGTTRSIESQKNCTIAN